MTEVSSLYGSSYIQIQFRLTERCVQLVFKVMKFCNLRELASLDATCKQNLVQGHAQRILESSPRAQKCLKPS